MDNNDNNNNIPLDEKEVERFFTATKIIFLIFILVSVLFYLFSDLFQEWIQRNFLAKLIRSCTSRERYHETSFSFNYLNDDSDSAELSDEEPENINISTSSDLDLFISSIALFRQLERRYYPAFLDYIETLELKTGEFLFEPCDSEEYMFVLKSGQLELYIIDEVSNVKVKIDTVFPGGNIHSLLALLDTITHSSRCYNTLCSFATEPSEVICLPCSCFLHIFANDPIQLHNIIQLISVRIERVILSSLSSCLGVPMDLLIENGYIDANLKTVAFNKLLNQRKPRTRPSMSESVLTRRFSRASLMNETKIYESFEIGSFNEDSEIQIVKEIESKIEAAIKLGTQAYAWLPSKMSNGIDMAFQKVKMSMMQDDASSEEFDTLTIENTNKQSDILYNDSEIFAFNFHNKIRIYTQESRDFSTSIRLNSQFQDILHEMQLSVEELLFLHSISCDDLANILQTESSFLKQNVYLTIIPGKTVFLEQGDEDMGLFYVSYGDVYVIHRIEDNKVFNMKMASPGRLVGGLSVITCDPSILTYQCLRPSCLVHISATFFNKLNEMKPFILQRVAEHVSKQLSPLLRQIDYAMEWKYLSSGRILFRKDDPPLGVYIVLSGRLKQIRMLDSKNFEVKNEFGSGMMFGMSEIVSRQARMNTVIAIRDTEIAIITCDLLDMLKDRVPNIVSSLIKMLASRLSGMPSRSVFPVPGRGKFRNMLLPNVNMESFEEVPHFVGKSPNTNIFEGFETIRTNAKESTSYKTIAIIARNSKFSEMAFTMELQMALRAITCSFRLTLDLVFDHLGKHALRKNCEYRLLTWLSKLEEACPMILFICDKNLSNGWTRRCLRQADCVLLLANFNDDPYEISEVEELLSKKCYKMERFLVLFHSIDSRRVSPGRTIEWLKTRIWVKKHFHIRCPQRMFKMSRMDDDLIVRFYARKFATKTISQFADMSRLARYLTNTSIGLVLGGGGARGLAHLGVIRGMQEMGIPIDSICGTSMGSFIAGAWAIDTNFNSMINIAQKFCNSMTNRFSMVFDLTFPLVSFLSGKHFGRLIESLFCNSDIEDLWIPYFCVTTDLTNSDMRIHSEGPLWPYVRASMTLAGFFPPLCDPEDGSLLIDGGYVNNLPADVMYQQRGVQKVIAVDVGARDQENYTNYGYSLNGFRVLLSKLFMPKGAKGQLIVPTLSEIQTRLAFVSCVRHLETVKESGICEYLRPNIDRFATLQFGDIDAIMAEGYSCVKRVFTYKFESPSQKSTDRVLFPRHSSVDLTNVPKLKRLTLIGPLTNTHQNFLDLANLVAKPCESLDPRKDSDDEL